MLSSSLGVLQTMCRITIAARVTEDFLEVFFVFFLPSLKVNRFLSDVLTNDSLLCLLNAVLENFLDLLMLMEMKILKRMR